MEYFVTVSDVLKTRVGQVLSGGQARESGQVWEAKWSDTGQYKFTFYKRITSQEWAPFVSPNHNQNITFTHL